MPTRPETVIVPAGEFTMGDDNARPDERPAHRVTVSAFRIAVLPVTNEDYAAFLRETGQEPPRFWNDLAFNQPRQPVVGANWYDAVAYCGWLSTIHGVRYRLPTEAEWERAARGGSDGVAYPWGDTPFRDDGRFPMESTWEVGAAPPNPYGIIDIGFNVHEWCCDWYDADYYAISPSVDPQGPRTGSRRSSRGGAWRHAVKVARCSARSSIPPDYKYNDYGFRLVEQL
jgi:formylglycine-generating enzyme